MMNRIDEQADPHFMLLKTVEQFDENDGEETRFSIPRYAIVVLDIISILANNYLMSS